MINLIPMAGHGNRFFQEKYNLPKPFVPVLGFPMFITSVSSFPKADSTIFICRQEHYDKYAVMEKARPYFPNSSIITIDKVTEGQACTCLLAKELLTPGEALYIASCDYQTIYDEARYQQLLADESIDVIIWTFKIGMLKLANPKAFAYCRVEGDRVTEIVEKQTISDNPLNDHAVVGSFTYRDSSLFVTGAEAMIAKNIRVNGEFYVGTSINQLIQSGRKVVVFEVNKYISFGNPFELNIFHFWEDYFYALEDHPYYHLRKAKEQNEY